MPDRQQDQRAKRRIGTCNPALSFKAKEANQFVKNPVHTKNVAPEQRYPDTPSDKGWKINRRAVEAYSFYSLAENNSNEESGYKLQGYGSQHIHEGYLGGLDEFGVRCKNTLIIAGPDPLHRLQQGVVGE
ncbi:hypothetical protein D3C87_1460070 [compost metagenome]